ncbi:MAG: metallophosphoesterase [Cloacibacillus evryensis]
MLCFAMTGLSPARRTKRLHHAQLRRWTDRAGSLWLLVVLYAFFTLIALETAGRFLGGGLPAWAELAASFALSLCLIALGVKQAHTIQTTKITVETEKLPPGEERLRIVQLTDLHLGPYTGVKLLAQILRRVRLTDPHGAVTGDVADGSLEGRGREIAMFRRIRPKYGVYAVTGNHDYYDGIDKALEFMRRAGMRVLRGESVCAGGIVVVGVDDRDHLCEDKWGLSRSETVIVNTKSRFRDKFILLLRHPPRRRDRHAGSSTAAVGAHHGGSFSDHLFAAVLSGAFAGFKKLKTAVCYIQATARDMSALQ